MRWEDSLGESEMKEKIAYLIIIVMLAILVIITAIASLTVILRGNSWVDSLIGLVINYISLFMAVVLIKVVGVRK